MLLVLQLLEGGERALTRACMGKELLEGGERALARACVALIMGRQKGGWVALLHCKGGSGGCVRVALAEPKAVPGGDATRATEACGRQAMGSRAAAERQRHGAVAAASRETGRQRRRRAGLGLLHASSR